jgi:ABC-type glutathione transport system ATPase component
MNQIITGTRSFSYLDQSTDVKARFERMKARETILEVRHLGKIFTAGKRETVALQDINFSTCRREILCVVGPSGCGKSTLVRILAGLEEQSSGEVLLEGKPVEGPGSDRGMVFQGYTLFPWLTVKKNVMFGLAAGTAMAAARRAGEIPERLSPSIVGRHETARRDCAGTGQSAPHSFDGRALRCARRADPLPHASASLGDLAQDRHHYRLHHA